MKISVILPVKNPDIPLLKKALTSVYEQSYSDYEILLINDGSDFAHAEELKQVAGENPAIRLLEIEPSGVSVARNFAAGKASGEILTYLDSDDFLSPFCFEEAVQIFETTDVDAIWGGTFYGTEKELQQRKNLHTKKQAFAGEELKNRLIVLSEERKHLSKAECIGEPYRFEDDTYISRGIAGRFIKKDKMMSASIEFPSGIRFYEDAIWNLKMIEGMRVSYFDSEWYYYLDNETSVSNAYNPEIVSGLETPLAMIREILDLENKEEYTGYTRILMDSLRYVSRCLFNNPKWDASAEAKRKLKKHLYEDTPWSEIKSEKYRIYAQERDSKKASLYSKKLLLFIWKYR